MAVTPKPPRAGEFELIARYFAPLAAAAPEALGLLDDAAVMTPRSGHELVVTTDALVAGVHFLPDDPPDLIARKALRVNLSDLAAKGAVPRWYLLDAVFPTDLKEDWIAAFARGLRQDQDEFGIQLIGGDTAATPGPLTLAITAMGEVPAGKMLRRSTARAGDDIYVSGTVGDGALGLLACQGKLAHLSENDRASLIARYRLPLPRVTLGPKLVGLATASLDVSDGVVADLGHICETSHLAATIEEVSLPFSDAARAALAHAPDLIDRTLGGGDDYEILFTAPPQVAPKLADLAGKAGIPLTRIGRMAAGEGVQIRAGNGRLRRLTAGGWSHF
jgi:thiamine-monophosphate kinase